MKNRNMKDSFKNAFTGIFVTFKNERNFKIHIFAAFAAIAASLILRIDVLSFAAVILAICTVLTAELINTALEAMVDLFCGNKISPYAKIAKDAGAAAVLISSFFALVIGLLVFGPKALEIIQNFVN